MPAFTQLNGINAIGNTGLGASASLLSTIVIVFIYMASTVVFMSVIDQFGRRTLLIAGSLQMLVSEVLIGAVMAAELGDEGGMSRPSAAALFVLTGLCVAGYSWHYQILEVCRVRKTLGKGLFTLGKQFAGGSSRKGGVSKGGLQKGGGGGGGAQGNRLCGGAYPVLVPILCIHVYIFCILSYSARIL